MTKFKTNIKFKLMNRTSSTSILDFAFMIFYISPPPPYPTTPPSINQCIFIQFVVSTQLDHCEFVSVPNRILDVLFDTLTFVVRFIKENNKKYVHGLICATFYHPPSYCYQPFIHPPIHFGARKKQITKIVK